MKTKKLPLDLSMLTAEEQQQFVDDPTTLVRGNIDVTLYLRFSSDRQSEQSIEGQLRDCIAYCKRKEYRITAIYIDRATTARKDIEKRVQFQQMISDSKHGLWELVIVWKLDRFARNREDSAVFKMRLRKNGVRVESATEAISNTPEGIILESVLEGIAEYYSADLSQKITRGMRESALKGHSIGGHVPLGYKIENHRLVVNPATAPIVQEAFERYANGESIADICRLFNLKGYRTAKGAEFNRSSFKSMFRNTRYIGTYTYKEITMEDTIPTIIDKELFGTVQKRLSKVAEAPARGKAKVDYLLSGKLFCGHCGASMNGESGTSKTGAVHNYYSCYSRKRKQGCDKRPLRKEWIETIVAQDALNLLTDDTIEEMADMALFQSEQDMKETTRIPVLTARQKEIEQGIFNITKAIEKGVASDTLLNRLTDLEKEKKSILKQITEENKLFYQIDRKQITGWLYQFKNGDISDDSFKRQLIDLLVNSVTVWDEPDGYRITTAYNLTTCKTKTFRVDSSGQEFGLEGLSSTRNHRDSVESRWFFYSRAARAHKKEKKTAAEPLSFLLRMEALLPLQPVEIHREPAVGSRAGNVDDGQLRVSGSGPLPVVPGHLEGDGLINGGVRLADTPAVGVSLGVLLGAHSDGADILAFLIRGHFADGKALRLQVDESGAVEESALIALDHVTHGQLGRNGSRGSLGSLGLGDNALELDHGQLCISGSDPLLAVPSHGVADAINNSGVSLVLFGVNLRIIRGGNGNGADIVAAGLLRHFTDLNGAGDLKHPRASVRLLAGDEIARGQFVRSGSRGDNALKLDLGQPGRRGSFPCLAVPGHVEGDGLLNGFVLAVLSGGVSLSILLGSDGDGADILAANLGHLADREGVGEQLRHLTAVLAAGDDVIRGDLSLIHI